MPTTARCRSGSTANSPPKVPIRPLRIRTTEGPLRIGVNVTSAETFRGAIDDVAIFGSALTGSEIATLYDVRSASMCNDEPTIAAPIAMPPGMVGQAYAQALTARPRPAALHLVRRLRQPACRALALRRRRDHRDPDQSPAARPSPPASPTTTRTSADREFDIHVGTCLMPNTDMAAWWAGEGNGDDCDRRPATAPSAPRPTTSPAWGQAFQLHRQRQSYVIVPELARRPGAAEPIRNSPSRPGSGRTST